MDSVAIEHVLIALFVSIPPTVASVCSVVIALLAYWQSKENGRHIQRVETQTNGLAQAAISSSKDAGRAEGIKEEILRKSIVPPTTPGLP